MDPELVAVDPAAVKIARGRGLFRQQNIPRAYERPGRWPATRTIANLPSILGIVSGPSRTVHALRAQSHLGPSLNLPAILSMRNDVAQILPSPIRDMLIARR